MSTSSAHERGYHHGDVVAEAIRCGLELLDQRSEGEIGLREIARAIGVSPTALYRHFPSKDDLRRAIAREAHQRLVELQQAEFAKHDNNIDAFNSTGHTYVHYAIEHPAQFRLMFTCTPIFDEDGHPHRDEYLGMRYLKDNAVGIVPKEWGEAAANLFALRAWSAVHGLAMLLIDGQVDYRPGIIEQMIDARVLLGPGPGPNPGAAA